MKKTSMRRALSALLSVMLVLAFMPAAVLAEGTILTGSGTNDAPYLIYTAEDLVAFRDRVNSGETAACGKLMADIVLNENFDQEKFAVDGDGNLTYNGGAVPETFSRWTPIGTETNPYIGTFDGNGHGVIGLYVNESDGYQGMFGWLASGGAIQNLGLIKSVVAGANYVGGLTGGNYGGRIKNVRYTGMVLGRGSVGGLVGYLDNNGEIVDSYHTGPVISNSFAGGIVGYGWDGSVRKSHNTGTVSGYASVGGIVGYNWACMLEECYNTGAVSKGQKIGGVIGWNYGSVLKCYNSATVSGGSSTGGVVGYNSGSITNSYNIGAVSGNVSAGGVVGYSNAEVENSYNIGTVCGREDYCGGLIGSLESCGTVTGSFFLAGSGTDNGAGTAAEEEQLKAQSTFENAGWDFDAVWCIAPDQNSGYPTLQIFSAPEKAAVTLSLSGQTYDEAQGRYYVTVSVHNQGEQSFSGTVYAAAYDGNRLVDVQEYAVSDLTSGETQTVSAELFTHGQVSQMKVFCWDLSSLRPVGAPAETAG